MFRKFKKNKTLQAREIVIVFDGIITPELEEMVMQYTSILPIKIIRLPKNVGLGKALNEGLKHCLTIGYSVWIQMIFVYLKRFEKQVEFINSILM